MKIKVFIVDDEAPVRNELKYILSQISDVSIAGETGSSSAALDLIRETKPDIVFLDIQMPGTSGLELSGIISDLENPPLIVFATAYDKYAAAAFDINAFDYVIKPFTLDRISKSIQKAERYLQKVSLPPVTKKTEQECLVNKLLLTKDEKIIPTSPDQIYFAESAKTGNLIHTINGICKAKLTLCELEEKLSSCGFIRVHRCYLVNLNHVLEVVPWFHGSCRLIINDKVRSEIEVSRYHVKELKAHFK
jgi:two-component system, LytTR family, response regulator LytT